MLTDNQWRNYLDPFRFRDKNEYSRFAEIVRIEDYAVATNIFVLCRIHKDLIPVESFQALRAENPRITSENFPQQTYDLRSFDLEQLPTETCSIPPIYHCVCEAGFAKGTSSTCPYCRTDPPRVLFRIGNNVLSRKTISLIAQLPDAKLNFAAEPNGMVYFTWQYGDGVVAPIEWEAA